MNANNKLKVRRFFEGMSQAELGRRVGCEQPDICAIENNRLKNTPRVIRLKRAICGVLGLSVMEIFPDFQDPVEKKSKP